MTHVDLFDNLRKRINRLGDVEVEILQDIISGLADKNDSLYEFYKEVIMSGDFVNLTKIKEIAKKYSVPELYRDHISERFEEFKKNLKIVCAKNMEMKNSGRPPGVEPEKWVKNNRRMFGSTELITIDKAGGIEKMCTSIHTVGYFDHLKKTFQESAIEVSKLKYSSLISENDTKIEYKS